jgi:hypothetical protein
MARSKKKLIGGDTRRNPITGTLKLHTFAEAQKKNKNNQKKSWKRNLYWTHCRSIVPVNTSTLNTYLD